MEKNSILVKFGKKIGVGAVVSSLVLGGMFSNTAFAARTYGNSSSNHFASGGHTPHDRAPRPNNNDRAPRDARGENGRVINPALKMKLRKYFLDAAMEEEERLKEIAFEGGKVLEANDMADSLSECCAGDVNDVWALMSAAATVYAKLVVTGMVFVDHYGNMNVIINLILGDMKTDMNEGELRKRICDFICGRGFVQRKAALKGTFSKERN